VINTPNRKMAEMDIVSAGNVLMMAEKTKDESERTWIHLKENGISVKVDDETFSRRPTRTKFFFNPKMITNREIALLALIALAEEKEAKSTTEQDGAPPFEALDAFAASGISGMRWKKTLASRAKVYLCENDKETFQRLVENCTDNGFNVLSNDIEASSKVNGKNANDSNIVSPDVNIVASNEDCNVRMLQQGFDFIHLDPFGSTVQHLDAAFKNVRQGGLVVLTSTDTGSLFGKVPSVAKRNYDAFVVKTEYFRELAARMVLGAAAKAAAKCNKGFQVLYVVAMEHFVQATVRICRGAQSADKTVEKVAKVVHCLVCEERSVVPNSNHPIDASSVQCLACDCTNSCDSSTNSSSSATIGTNPQRGRNRILLGPVWCGKIFDADFVKKMEDISGREGDDMVAVCAKTKEILGLLKAEAVCSSTVSSTSGTESVSKPENDNSTTSNEEYGCSAKRRRLSSTNGQIPSSIGKTVDNLVVGSTVSSDGREAVNALCEHSEGEPVFYYSTHVHVPKGLELIKMDRLVDLLRKQGFRASRTHLDSMSVRTNANSTQLKQIFEQHCHPIPASRKN